MYFFYKNITKTPSEVRYYVQHGSRLWYIYDNRFPSFSMNYSNSHTEKELYNTIKGASNVIEMQVERIPLSLLYRLLSRATN